MRLFRSLPSIGLFVAVAAVGAASLTCLGRSAGVVAPVQDVEIRLRSRTIAPRPGIEMSLKQSLEQGDRERVHAIVQLRATPTLDQHQTLLQAGVILQEYLGANAYAASIRRGLILDAGPLQSLIRWAGDFQPVDKLETMVAARQFPDWARTDTGTVRLLVQFFPDVDPQTANRDLATLSLEGQRYGAANTWIVTAAPQVIDRMATLRSIKWIEAGPIPALMLTRNEGGRRVANSDEAQQATFNNPQPGYRNVSGQGINIGICDTGIDQNHNDFDAVNNAGAAGASRVYNQRAGSGSHGTHVASIAGGSGLNSANNGFPAFSLRGHAPRANLGDYPTFGSDVQQFHDAIVNDGTNVTNHSYVQSFTVYNTTAADLDVLVRGDAVDNNQNPIPARPQVWAAGNNGFAAQWGDEEGYYSIFTSAKNTISVGGVDTRDTRLYRGTSLGPSFDGRIKPDIVAPGCLNSIGGGGIQAASSGTQGYTGNCGTSMAAPVVSGIIALMMEEFQNGGGQIANLLPSTYKAILVHSARDMVKTEEFDSREFDNPDTQDPVLYHAGPDYATGFGLVDADQARRTIANTGLWREAALSTTGARHTYCVRVPEGSREFKVVIAWDDEAGSTMTAETAAKLVNDLDLELVDPNGNVYLPWTLDPLPLTANPGDGAQDPIGPGDVNPAYRGVDHRNNVEMASVFLPTPGQWRIRVTAGSLPTGNTQSYSLVTSDEISTLCLIGPVDICSRYPWICPRFEICDRYPWICTGLPEIPEFTIVDSLWNIDTRIPIAVDEICKYVIDCPGCGGSGWSYCPGWDVAITRLPPDAIVTVFDDRGAIVAADSARAPTRRLRIDRRRAQDRFFVLITDRQGEPFGERLRLGIDLQRLRN